MLLFLMLIILCRFLEFIWIFFFSSSKITCGSKFIQYNVYFSVQILLCWFLFVKFARYNTRMCKVFYVGSVYILINPRLVSKFKAFWDYSAYCYKPSIVVTPFEIFLCIRNITPSDIRILSCNGKIGVPFGRSSSCSISKNFSSDGCIELSYWRSQLKVVWQIYFMYQCGIQNALCHPPGRILFYQFLKLFWIDFISPNWPRWTIHLVRK